MQLFLDFYRENARLFYNTQLVLAMFGMGATSSVAQFRSVFRRPWDIALVLFLQYLLMPSVAVALAWITQLPPPMTVGLVLLASLPSGSLSNILTFLGRGNVALSITTTCASTAICLLATPIVLDAFTIGHLPEGFHMPWDQILLSIVLLLVLPLVVGMVIGSLKHSWRRPLSKLAVWGSMIAVGGVWVGAIGGGQIEILHYGWQAPALIVVFIVLSMLVTNEGMLAMGYQKDESFTLSIEVSMRNGNLGIALLTPLFGELTRENDFHQGGLYSCLFGGGAMMVFGLIAVGRRHLRFALQRRAKQAIE
ncbi:bile acid:sodium symporter family protein [Aeoliella mucimassa]|uniref:Sodium Bile acid symporter family protein n=1 Tax=Aeoliella mucimassa TaxID=2527972 RepID=A0A518AJM4_9BACT|nr:bile acid:sodium symporter [Aeoliella mucimassa]QDU54937.1 Sodium Bile acid symporter family protein [Aeoliella mucimassa]